MWQMKEKKLAWGELVVPAIAVAYSVYAILEQTLAQLETKTIIYSFFLILPIFLCAAIIFYSVLRTRKEIQATDEMRRQSARGRNNILLFLLWAGLFLGSLYVLGYFIAIFVYLGVFLWAMGERSWYKAAALSAAATVSVHFLFVQWIGMPLPKGLLKGIL
jgi:hypothetical protein